MATAAREEGVTVVVGVVPAASQLPPSKSQVLRVVPIPLERVAGGFQFKVDSFSLGLKETLPDDEFDAIVDELNSTLEQYAPRVSAHKAALFVPLIGLVAIPVLDHKMARLRRKVEAACAKIGKRYAGRGVALRVVDAKGAGSAEGEMGAVRFRVDLEVEV